MPPTMTVSVSGRVRGKWRLKAAAWLIRSLRFQYRIGKGKWRTVDQRLTVSVD